jgi:hypothetical protein
MAFDAFASRFGFSGGLMSIRILDKATAVAGFGPAQRPYGDVVFCSRIRTTHWLMNVREWSAKSRTAQEILKFVENSSVVINLIGMEGGFQCFDHEAINHSTGKPEPTIYVDVTGRLSCYVHNVHQVGLILAYERVVDPKPFDNRLATLHELGHAKQFIERPGWYALYSSAEMRMRFRDKIEEGAAKRWKPRPPAVINVPSTGSSDAPPPPPPRAATGGAQMPAFLGKRTDRAVNQKWFVVLDVDNITRHEWPMCRELGMPIRLSYTDLTV